MKIFSWSYFSEVFMGVDVPMNRSKPVRGAFYRGSLFFNPFAEFLQVPLDQVNYMICGVLSFFIGQFIRHKLSPKHYSARIRGFVEIIFGILLLSFCFGNQLRVLILQSSVAYLLMLCLPPNRFMAVIVTTWSMFYLTLVHFCRLQYDYGGYTMDISGPVMVQTQRLSSLAFNLVDGARLLKKKRDSEQNSIGKSKVNGNVIPNGRTDYFIKQMKSGLMDGFQSISNLRSRIHTSDSNKFCMTNHHHQSDTATAADISTTGDTISDTTRDSAVTTTNNNNNNGDCNTEIPMPANHVKHAVEAVPNPIEFFAYTLYFHGSIVGPFLFYSEYTDYLKGYDKGELPPMNIPYLGYLFFRIFISAILSGFVSPWMPFDFVLTDTYMAYPLYQRILYIAISLLLIRQRYYFAWGLSELNGGAIGLGYTGICPRTGRSEYNHVRNFNIKEVESGLNLKNIIDAWNIATTRWLREVFYDRLPSSYRTVLVFIISAFWHGFYLGYYVMFLSFALFTMTSRIWHKHYRQYFRKSPQFIPIYDFLTMVITNFIINYGQSPFHLLDLSKGLIFLSSFFYLPHLIAVVILLGHFTKVYFSSIMPNQRKSKLALNHGRSVGT